MCKTRRRAGFAAAWRSRASDSMEQQAVPLRSRVRIEDQCCGLGTTSSTELGPGSSWTFRVARRPSSICLNRSGGRSGLRNASVGQWLLRTGLASWPCVHHRTMALVPVAGSSTGPGLPTANPADGDLGPLARTTWCHFMFCELEERLYEGSEPGVDHARHGVQRCDKDHARVTSTSPSAYPMVGTVNYLPFRCCYRMY